MASAYTLDFEKPLLELERQIEELKRIGESGRSTSRASSTALQSKLESLRAEIYRNLTPMQRVMVARHPRRPYTLDYVSTIFTDFIELHGDRASADDPAIVGGWARLDGESVMVIGHQKGRDTKENLQAQLRHAAPRGLPQGAAPDEARREVRRAGHHLHRHARAPIPASAPRSAASREAHRAEHPRDVDARRRPIIAVVIGEGGSGGALALGVADRILMLENSVYSVISPEGCAAILWKDASQRERAAEALKITARGPAPAQGDRRDRHGAGRRRARRSRRHRRGAPRGADPPRHRAAEGQARKAGAPPGGEVRARWAPIAKPDDRRPSKCGSRAPARLLPLGRRGRRRSASASRWSSRPSAAVDLGRVTAVGDAARRSAAAPAPAAPSASEPPEPRRPSRWSAAPRRDDLRTHDESRALGGGRPAEGDASGSARTSSP